MCEKKIVFTDREEAIMNEAFITGKIYVLRGEHKSDDKIFKELKENCSKAIQYDSLLEEEKIWC